LLAGKSVVVKKAVPHDIAQAYCRRLTALGVQTHVEASSAATESVAAPSRAATVKPAAATADAERPAARANRPVPPRRAPSPTVAAQPYFNTTAKARSSTAYMSALLRAAAMTALLLAGYALVTTATIFLTLFYAIHFAYLLIAPPVLFSATVYLLPLLVLMLMSVLLLRPFVLPLFFGKRGAISAPLSISPTTEPRLFQFIEELCTVVAAPMPREVHMDAGTGAVVALKPGLKNFWSGTAVLTIGLPPLQTLSLRAYAGMLARTLGQAGKPTALRCAHFLQTVAGQLDDCVNSRDIFSVALQQRAERARQPAAALALRAAQACLDVSTVLLRRIATRITALRAPLQRAAELEADRYQILVAGSRQFAGVLIELQKLDSAGAAATAKNLEQRSDGGLVDNLPALIRHYYDSFDEQFVRELRRRWEAEALRSGAERSVKERIESAAADNASGLIDRTEAAASLLNTAAALENQSTRLLYRQLGLAFEEHALLPVHTLVYAATEELLQRQQADSYFNGWFRPPRFWSLPDYKLIQDMPQTDAVQQLNVCVSEIRRLTPDREKLLADYDKLQNQIHEILLGQQVLAAGGRFDFRYFQYSGTALQPLLEERQQQLIKVVEQLSLQEGIMGGRLALGLRLSGQPGRIMENLHTALSRLRGIDTRLYKFSVDVYLLGQLLQRHYQMREAKYASPIARLEEKLGDAANVLLERLRTIPWSPDDRFNSLHGYVEPLLRKFERSTAKTAILDRAQTLLNAVHAANEKLNELAADYGTIAERSYRIKRIRLIREE
jgi:hypothetical protein